MGEAVSFGPFPVSKSIKEDSNTIYIEAMPSFTRSRIFPKTIANPLPFVSGQHLLKFLTRMPLVILITRHGRGFSFWGVPRGVFDKV